MKTASRISITVVVVLLAVAALAAPGRANPGIKTSSTTNTSPTSSITSTTDTSSTSSTSPESSTSSTTLPPLKSTSAPKIYRLDAVPKFASKSVSYSTVENNGVECWDRSLKSLRASNALSRWLRNQKSTVKTAPSPVGLPTFPGATAYCVTVEEKRPERLAKGFKHRGLIYSLYSEETHTPVAVFFRFPMAGETTSRPPINWPFSVAPQPEAWVLDKLAYKAGTTPGSFVDAKLESWQLPEARGHMVASAYFDGDNDFQAATFNFANAFPSFNRASGKNSKPIIPWDGEIWGGREKALQAYATVSRRGLEQLFVVVGTSQTNPQMYIPLNSAKDNIDRVAGPTRDQLADVPQYAWTAVYDSVSKTALAWDCLVRVDNIVTDPKKDIASCNYVSVNDIAKKYNVDPFPGIDDEARKNKYPSKFIKPAVDANATAFAADAMPPPPDWLVTEEVEPVVPTSSTPNNVLSPSTTSAPKVTLVNKLVTTKKKPTKTFWA